MLKDFDEGYGGEVCGCVLVFLLGYYMWMGVVICWVS